MEEFTLTREELLEFAKMATFRLDDRLCPFSREELRAESWLAGYWFARSHQPQPKQDDAPIDGLSGVGMIVEERGRQIWEHGYTDEHDRQHKPVDFVRAAMAYLALHNELQNASEVARGYWPFDPQYFKPRSMERDLVRAGALIAAGIDRMNQKEE